MASFLGTILGLHLNPDVAPEDARPVEELMVVYLGPEPVVEEGVPVAPISPEQSRAVCPVSDAESLGQLAGGVGEFDAPDGGGHSLMGER